MTRDNDDQPEYNSDLTPRYGANSLGKKDRSMPSLGGIGESDRDTEYPLVYRANDLDEEEEFYDEFPEDDDVDDPSPEEDVDSRYQSTSVQSESNEVDSEDPDDWPEDDNYPERHESGGSSWPIGLIAVAIVALILLTAGIYGVMQERAATQEELRELRASLAISSDAEDILSTREALEGLKESYDKLTAEAEELSLENLRLTDTVEGLEAQLEAQQAALDKEPVAGNQARPAGTGQASPPQVSTGQPVPSAVVAPKPTTTAPDSPAAGSTSPATTAASGPWFVNFGSYASRPMAEDRAGKLRPITGKVLVAPSTIDGKTLYRVRVVDLASKNSAQAVARKLEADLQVSELWVGKE